MKWSFVLTVLTACSFDPSAAKIDAAFGDDAPGEAAPADAAPLGAFGSITPLAILNSSDLEDDPSLTADMRELFFASNRGNSFYDEDIYVSTRDSTAVDFGTPSKVTELNVEISADGLTITFTSDRGGNDDLWIAKRETRTTPWGTPVLLPELNSLSGEYGSVVTTLGTGQLEMTLCSARGGNEAVYVTRKAPNDTMYPAPTIADGVDTTDHECDAARPDENTLYFTRARTGAPTQLDLFRARWDGTRWIEVEAVTELNTAFRDSDPWVSPDHRTIYFSRDTNDNARDDLYMATR